MNSFHGYDGFISNFTWGTPPINNPTENLKTRIQMKEGEADVRLPYQNKKNVVQIKVGRLPYLSAIIPHNGAPIIIPKKIKSFKCYFLLTE